MRTTYSSNKEERGVTILIVGLTLLVLVAMAALAIDVASLYVTRGEAQRAADAAALAGARMFVTSGFTTGLPAALAPDVVCKNDDGTAAVNQQAALAAKANFIAGQPGVIKKVTCLLSNPQNPRVAVTVQRTGAPTFFARVFGIGSNAVTATATAEAYNPSGQDAPIAIEATSVKPWLLPNCDPNGPAGPCANGYFVDPINGSTTANATSYIGSQILLKRRQFNAPQGTGGVLEFYGLHFPDAPAPVCPTSPASCGPIPGSGNYVENIACASSLKFYCGQPIGPAPDAIPVESKDVGGNTPTRVGTRCLIHANGDGDTQGQDEISLGVPISITGGRNNPNTSLRNVRNISRSDSIVIVPLYDGRKMCNSVVPNNPGFPDTCQDNPQSTTVIGFLQLGIQQSTPTTLDRQVQAVVLNAVGCGTLTATFPPTSTISVGGSSPIPVRLVQTPTP